MDEESTSLIASWNSLSVNYWLQRVHLSASEISLFIEGGGRYSAMSCISRMHALDIAENFDFEGIHNIIANILHVVLVDALMLPPHEITQLKP